MQDLAIVGTCTCGTTNSSFRKVCRNCGKILMSAESEKMQMEETHLKEEKRSFAGGKLTSTKQPRLSLIPHAGLVNAAVQFELGLVKHPGTAYNNLVNEIPTDKDWLIERASHAAEHCFCIIDKLLNNDYTLCDRDAGAVAWFGLVMGEVAVKIRERQLDNCEEQEGAKGIK